MIVSIVPFLLPLHDAEELVKLSKLCACLLTSASFKVGRAARRKNDKKKKTTVDMSFSAVRLTDPIPEAIPAGIAHRHGRPNIMINDLEGKGNSSHAREISDTRIGDFQENVGSSALKKQSTVRARTDSEDSARDLPREFHRHYK